MTQFNTNKLYYHFLADDCVLQDGTIAEVGKIEYAADQDSPLDLCSAACVHACENPVECFGYARGLRISGVYFPDDTISDDDKTGAKMRYRQFILSPEVSKVIVWKFLKFCLEQAFEVSRKAGYEPDPRSMAVVDILNRLIEQKEIPQDELNAAADAAARAAADAAYAAADAAQKEYLINLIDEARFKA